MARFKMLGNLKVNAMSVTKCTEYRQRADECLAKAQATNNILTKLQFLTLAEHWKAMAKDVETDARRVAYVTA